MRRFILLLMTFISLAVLGERKKVGLVLGGGGAKGAAHVGVLKIFEEARIPIDYIAGTSIGAIIGGLYSIGYDAEALDSLVRHMDWSFLLSNNVPQGYRSFRARDIEGKYVISYPYSLKKKNGIPAGLITGQNILNLFSGLTIGYHDVKSFMNLPIPFRCVATNLVSENYVVLEDGSLPLSMRSSMSIPGVFMPVELDSMILVDGGVINNFPTNVVKEMGADIVIGIDLSTGKTPPSQLKTILGLINTLTDITGKDDYEKNKKGLNLYMNPDLKGFQTMDFSSAAMDSMYLRGVECARRHWDEIIALKKEIYGNEYTTQDSLLSRNYVHYLPVDTLQIGSVTVMGVDTKILQLIRDKIKIDENSKITLKNINDAIAVLDGMDIFSSVTYRLSDTAPYDLTFVLKEQQLNHLNIGVRFDSEEMASILLNTTFYESFFRGSKFSVTTKLNISPYLALHYEWRPNFSSKIALSYKIGYENFDLYRGKHKIDDIYYLWQTGEIKYGVLLKNWEIEAGAEWNYFGKSSQLYKTNYSPVPIPSASYFNYYAKVGVNSLNDLYFATKGIDLSFKLKLITTNFITYNNNSPLGDFSLRCSLPVKLHKKLFLLPELAGRAILGDDIPTIYQNYAGGCMFGRYVPQQIAIPGVRNIQVFDNVLLLLRVATRWNFLKNQYLFAAGGYGKSSSKLGAILDGTPIWTAGVRYSYNSQFGPLGAELNYSNRDKGVNVYVNIGYSF